MNVPRALRSGQFQSTRPRGARHHMPRPEQPMNGVSIHAPARGATLIGGHQRCKNFVSIHAPARGATTPYGRLTYREVVSIHAPARGAT